MRLTKYQKEAFVRAVMDDVPDTDEKKKEITTLLTEAILNLAPHEVRVLWNKYGTTDLFATCKVQFSNHYFCNLPPIFKAQNFQSSWVHSEVVLNLINSQVAEKVKSLEAELSKAEVERKTLRTKLTAVANGCSTLKQLQAQLPEFQKYMPQEAAKSENLPALANLVTDFVKAGWPKHKEATHAQT